MATEDAMAFAEANSLAFIETSALDATGVDDAFRQILTEIYRLVGKRQAGGQAKDDLPSGKPITVNKENTTAPVNTPKSGCCK